MYIALIPTSYAYLPTFRSIAPIVSRSDIVRAGLLSVSSAATLPFSRPIISLILAAAFPSQVDFVIIDPVLKSAFA